MKTRLVAVRNEGLRGPEIINTILIEHTADVDPEERLEECLSAWFKTEEGQEEWNRSCQDNNYGDLVVSPPSDEFMARFGLHIDREDEIPEVIVNHDHVLGSPDEWEEESEE